MANVKTNTGAGKRTENKTTQSSTYKKKVETVVPQEIVEKNQEVSEDVKVEGNVEEPQVLTEVEVDEKDQEVPDEVGSEEPQVLTEEIKTESRTGVFVAQHLTPSSRIRGTYGATKFC